MAVVKPSELSSMNAKELEDNLNQEPATKHVMVIAGPLDVSVRPVCFDHAAVSLTRDALSDRWVTHCGAIYV